MIDQEDDMNGNETQYASLTAGLLARKGEAVPAAAAFTAEAIAQHIPARRLAQEAERVLLDRRPKIDHVIEDTSVAWREAELENHGAQAVTEHRDMIERAFDESVLQDEGMPSIQQPPGQAGSIDEFLDPSRSPEPEVNEMDLGSRRELNLPYVGSLEDTPLEDTSKGAPASAVSEHLTDGSALSDLNDSDGNWFETIVSKAISEAEGLRSAIGSARDAVKADLATKDQSDEPVEGSLVSSTFAEGMTADRESSEPDASVPSDASVPDTTAAPSGGCGDKAARVREAIRSGKTGVAARSAMRLDPRRFIRLSLAAQKLQLSSQEVMVAALDTYMDTLEEEVFKDCACMKNGLI